MINFELAHGNFPQVVALYEKALRGLGGNVGAVPGVEIWREYLWVSYIPLLRGNS